MMITCILLATGRLERLEESIASFLSQDFAGEKELIIINVLHRQTLVFEHPDVRIYNLKSQTMRYDQIHDAESVIRRNVGVSSKFMNDRG